MSRRQHLDESQRWRVIGRLEAGQSQSEVSRALNIPQNVISRLWRRFCGTGEVRRREGQGRPRATTSSEDRYMALTARRNRQVTARQLTMDLAAATGTRISRFTVYRRLHERGLYARRPMVCVPLTSSARGARLRWSRQHRLWSPDDWAPVLFTDESRYSLNTDSRRTLIWREPGTRNSPSNIRERSSFHGGGLLVWGGIITNGRTDLHIFQRGSVTGQRYRDDILHPYVRLFRGVVGPDFRLMDDNARPHRAQLVEEYLESEDIVRMDWPAHSPDMNPIEHVWDALGRRVAERQPPPRTLQELRLALLQEWQLIPQDLINSLINTMDRRCECCMSVRGGHTPY